MSDLLGYVVNEAGAKVVALIAIMILLDLRTSFRQMAKSIDLLTVQMATVVTRVDTHEKRIDHLEEKRG